MSKMLFITVQDFKTRYAITTDLEVVINPNTKKWFISTQVGNFKCEVGLSKAEPIKYMYESQATFEEGCFVNVSPASNNVQFSL